MAIVDRILKAVGLSRLTEQLLPMPISGGDIDPDAHLYRSLTGSQRDISPLTQDRVLQLAGYLYETNPLARRIAELTKDFVVGDGFTVSSPVPEIHAVLTKLWHDPITNLAQTQHLKALELGLYGEQVFVAFTNEVTGHVRLGVVDPLNVAAVLHDPDNRNIPIGVLMKKSLISDPVTYRVIYPAPDSELFSDTTQQLRAGYDGGECFYFSVNKLTGQSRGRSDLLSLIDWLDGYDRYLFDTMERSALINAFVWDVKLLGAKQPEIDAWLAKNGAPPKPGTVRAHNEGEEWTAVTADLKHQDVSEGARLLRNHVLGGSGTPEHWFSEGGDVNRACHSEDTETLTSDGWKALPDLHDGDRIATYNLSTGHMEFHPGKLFIYEHAGEMIRFKSAGVDILVTPEHRMWVGYERNSQPPRWEKTKAGEIAHERFLFLDHLDWKGREQQTFILPAVERNNGANKSFPSKASERTILMDDWLEFLGYVVSEGCIFEPGKQTASVGQYKVSLSQSVKANPEKAAHIGECLARLPFAFAFYDDADGTRRWQVSDKGLWMWLRREVGRLSCSKRIPTEFKALNKRQLSILFEALMLGDGTSDQRSGRTNRSYSSNSHQLAGDVQEVALKLGYRARVRQATRAFSVELRQGGAHILEQRHISREQYSGLVYCFNVPNHLFITRRNGKVAITHNTAAEMSTPVFRRLVTRQLFVKEMFNAICRYQIVKAIEPAPGRRGPLAGFEQVTPDGWKEAVPATEAFDIQESTVSSKDLQKAGTLLLTVSQGVNLAVLNKLMKPETAVKLLAAAANELGVDVNPQEELATPGSTPLAESETARLYGEIQAHLSRLHEAGKNGTQT